MKVKRGLLGSGDIRDNTIRFGQLFDTRGGRFGADFNPADVIMENAGSLSISFVDCSSALVNYSVDGNGGNQTTSRLTRLHGHGCSDDTPAPANDFSGSWYDPSHNGEGFIIEQLSGANALVMRTGP